MQIFMHFSCVFYPVQRSHTGYFIIIDMCEYIFKQQKPNELWSVKFQEGFCLTNYNLITIILETVKFDYTLR